jgi:hypothetical protein
MPPIKISVIICNIGYPESQREFLFTMDRHGAADFTENSFPKILAIGALPVARMAALVRR